MFETNMTPRNVLLKMAKVAYEKGLVSDDDIIKMIGAKSGNLNSVKGRSYYRVIEALKLKPAINRKTKFLDGWD